MNKHVQDKVQQRRNFGMMPDETERSFAIEQRAEDSRAVLVLTGILGVDAAGELRSLAMELRKDTAIDWSGVEYAGAAAIQVLVALEAALSTAGLRFSVSSDSATVRRHLELAGLSERFPVR